MSTLSLAKLSLSYRLVRTWGLTIQGGVLNLRYSLANDPPDLGDFAKLHPVSCPSRRSTSASSRGPRRPELIKQESLIPDNVGRPCTISPSTLDAVRTFGLPRRLEKELPTGGAGMIIRQSTIDLARRLDSLKSKGSVEGRYVLGQSGDTCVARSAAQHPCG